MESSRALPYQTVLASLACLAASLLICRPLQAGQILVLNPSFESPAQLDGGFEFVITDWTSSGGGVFNPVTGVHYSGPGATNGVQVGFINTGFISQVLGATLAANNLYTLQVDVGDRLDTAFPGYTVGLFAGGNLLAQDNSSLTPNDGFLTSTVTFLALPSNPSLGQPLEIGLTSVDVQTNFDDVRLDATAVSQAVPEPASCALLGLGLVGLGTVTVRRRKRTRAEPTIE